MRSLHPRSVALVALAVVLGLASASCGADVVPVSTGVPGSTTDGTTVTTAPAPIPEGAAGLQQARERWASTGITAYSMTYATICFCPRVTATVTVRGGALVDTEVDSTTIPGTPADGLTVDDLFGEIQAAVDEGAAEIQATYDPATGRPTRYWVDESRMMEDEEHGIEVTGFVAGDPSASPSTSEPPVVGGTEPSVVTTGTSQPPQVRAVAQAQLTEPWGCGWGFVATDPVHDVALVLQPTAKPPAGASSVSLPAPGWQAEVQLGTDLFTVDCAGLDLQRSPAPAESWPVVAGSLQITAPDLGWCGGGGPLATAVATGLTVEAPDGTTITFADLSLVNDQWGCAAG